MSAAFSPITIDGALALPDVSAGMIEASATRSRYAMDPKRVDDGLRIRTHLLGPYRMVGLLREVVHPADPRFLPVFDRSRKYSIAARRLGRAVERVSGRAPNGIVWCGPVRLQRGFVPVNLEEVVDVLVLLVVKNVEAQAASLIPLGANGTSKVDSWQTGVNRNVVGRSARRIVYSPAVE